MQDTFTEYLNEQKKNNAYTSNYDVVNEAKWFDKLTGKDKTIEAYGVKINFNKTDVIDHLVENLKKKDILDKGTELKDEDQFKTLVSDEISSYIRKLAELFQKNNGHIDVRVDNDRIPVYVFEKYREDDEKGYANSFKEAISQDTDGIGFLASVADIIPVKITNRAKKEKKKSIYSNPPGKTDNEDAVANSKVVINVVADILSKVQEKIKANKEKADKGDLIEVYSFPFKVADTVITSIAKECKENNENIGTFYNKLVTKIQEDLVHVLENLDNINDYIGLIPVKNYGFNMYFSDQTTAERAAEELNEADTKVTSRKRYAKKMGNLVKVLESVTIAGKEFAGPGVEWFRNRQFAKDHIGMLIKDIYPEADSQIDIKIATANIDAEWLKNMCMEDGNFAGDNGLLKNIKEKIISHLTESGKDNFISASSDGSTLIFMFKGTTSDSNIETYLKGILPSAKITIKKSVLTAGEIKGRQESMRKINDNDTNALKTVFTSLFTAMEKSIGKDIENAGEEVSDSVIFTMNQDDMAKLRIKDIKTIEEFIREFIANIINENSVFMTMLMNHLMEKFSLCEAEEEARPKKKLTQEQIEKRAELKRRMGGNAETQGDTNDIDNTKVDTAKKEIKLDNIKTFEELYKECVALKKVDNENIPMNAVDISLIAKLPNANMIFNVLLTLIKNMLNNSLKKMDIEFSVVDGNIQCSYPNKYKQKIEKLSAGLNTILRNK